MWQAAAPVRAKAKAAGQAMRALLLELDPELSPVELEAVLLVVQKAVSREMEWIRARRESGYQVRAAE